MKGADWSRHIFVHSATVMASKQKSGYVTSSSVHCGQNDSTYASIGGILRKAFVDDTILGDEGEPARLR